MQISLRSSGCCCDSVESLFEKVCGRFKRLIDMLHSEMPLPLCWQSRSEHTHTDSEGRDV